MKWKQSYIRTEQDKNLINKVTSKRFYPIQLQITNHHNQHHRQYQWKATCPEGKEMDNPTKETEENKC